jgi:hypothetical protein
MKESEYNPPLVRNILLGILAALAFFLMFNYLSQLVKWGGATMLFLPARLGIIRQASFSEVIQVDFSTSPTQVSFPRAGQYAFYTSNHDLLVITDMLIEAEGKPWLVLTSESGQKVPVAFIARGLMPYDTPLASGRPIYTLQIPQAGNYTIAHPTRPLLTVQFVPDYVTGKERLHSSILTIETLGLIALGVFLVYRRRNKVEGRFKAARREKRQQVDAFWKEQRQKKSQTGEAKKPDRWNDL